MIYSHPSLGLGHNPFVKEACKKYDSLESITLEMFLEAEHESLQHPQIIWGSLSLCWETPGLEAARVYWNLRALRCPEQHSELFKTHFKHTSKLWFCKGVTNDLIFLKKLTCLITSVLTVVHTLFLSLGRQTLHGIAPDGAVNLNVLKNGDNKVVFI